MLNSMKDGMCGCVKDVWLIPTGGAKHISPLDNALWHSWKDCVREKAADTHEDLVKAIKKCWHTINAQQLSAYYHHCALFAGQDSYKGRA